MLYKPSTADAQRPEDLILLALSVLRDIANDDSGRVDPSLRAEALELLTRDDVHALAQEV